MPLRSRAPPVRAGGEADGFKSVAERRSALSAPRENGGNSQHHAPARRRLHVGQRRQGYSIDQGLPRSPRYSAYRSLHRVVADQVLELLPRLSQRAAFPRRGGLFGGRDCSGVVAQAIHEPRHRHKVDRTGHGHREQPGEGHRPSWIPTNRHHFPLDARSRGHSKPVELSGAKNRALTAPGYYCTNLTACHKQIVNARFGRARLRKLLRRPVAGRPPLDQGPGRARSHPVTGRSPRGSAIGRRGRT